MNCKDLFRWMETGGPWARIRARVHAERCPDCAGARRRLLELKQQLAASPPLGERHRELWLQAAARAWAAPGSEAPVARRAPRLTFALAGAAAAVLVAIGVWWLVRGEPSPLKAPGSPGLAAIPPQVMEEARRQTESMRADLLALSRELDRLAREASLLDERREMQSLVAQVLRH